MKSSKYVLLMLVCMMVTAAVWAGEVGKEWTVAAQTVSDPKVVFATVESVDVVPARARIAGTIVSLNVKEGDEVKAGQEIATVGDEKLALQSKSLEAQIIGLESQSEKANADLKRIQALIGTGAVAQSTLDAAKATASSASNDLKARKSQRDVILQQVTEGKILAPVSGRVLHVPLTSGSVVMAGETIATIAMDSYILRIQLPERHAQFLRKGDKIRLDASEIGQRKLDGKSTEGEISLIYPAIENGRVQADIVVPDLENYFVGERVRVWVSTTERPAILIPQTYIKTRSGVDYVRIKSGQDGQGIEVPIQCARNSRDPSQVEILSGLRSGDILLLP